MNSRVKWALVGWRGGSVDEREDGLRTVQKVSCIGHPNTLALDGSLVLTSVVPSADQRPSLWRIDSQHVTLQTHKPHPQVTPRLSC